MSATVDGFRAVKALSSATNVCFGTLADGSYCVVHSARGRRSAESTPPTLRGPSIAGVLQVVNTDTHVSVVSEPGVSLLSTRLDVVKRLSEPDCKYVVRQAVDALQALHATLSTHGLVSVDAFLLQSTESDVHVLLTDFAFQRVLDASSYAELLRQRPSSLAPEVIESLRAHGSQGLTISPAADVWGLGVTLYVLLSGVAPFVDGHSDVLANILRGRVSFEHARWKTVSVEAKAFVTQMLSVAPDARPTLTAIAAHPWLQSVSVPPAPTGGRVVEPDKPREQIVVLEPTPEPEEEVEKPVPAPAKRQSSAGARKRDRDASPPAPTSRAASSAAVPAPAEAAPAAAEPQAKKVAHAVLTASAMRKLKVAELRNECTARGLATTGTKDVLVARIVQFQEGK